MKVRWTQLLAVLVSLAAVAAYAWLVDRIEEYQMRATTYGALVLLALVVVGLPLGVAEVVMRWRRRPVRLKVDWPMLLTYGLPGLMLAEIALIWLWVKLPPGLSAMALALGEQEPIATAAGGFLLGIAVARAVRLEAQAPPSPARPMDATPGNNPTRR